MSASFTVDFTLNYSKLKIVLYTVLMQENCSSVLGFLVSSGLAMYVMEFSLLFSEDFKLAAWWSVLGDISK